MQISDNLSERVNAAIATLEYPAVTPELFAPIKYTLEEGGKRLRPRLLLASYIACGGKSVEEVMPQTLGLEMFHNFTLLHDDVMDNADIRRGRPTVHRKWGVDTAILSGDTMLTMATQLVAKCPDEKLREVLRLFNDTAMEIYEGQQMDMEFERTDNVAVSDYLEMIRLKTSVLLGCACRMGAYLAGASEEDCGRFYDYGIDLGLAFQLRDDWLDTFGDPLEFGKEIGGDIVNNKKTWLLITAMEESSDELSAILAEDLEDRERIRQVVRVYDSLGLSDRCCRLVNSYVERAVACLDKVDMTPEARDFFVSLAKKSATRTH